MENIIEKLQDIDKLKMILLDENQRKLFSLIPKPGIKAKTTEENQHLTMESLIDLKKIRRKKEPMKTVLKNLDDNSLNRKMIEFMDLRARSELNEIIFSNREFFLKK